MINNRIVDLMYIGESYLDWILTDISYENDKGIEDGFISWQNKKFIIAASIYIADSKSDKWIYLLTLDNDEGLEFNSHYEDADEFERDFRRCFNLDKTLFEKKNEEIF